MRVLPSGNINTGLGIQSYGIHDISIRQSRICTISKISDREGGVIEIKHIAILLVLLTCGKGDSSLVHCECPIEVVKGVAIITGRPIGIDADGIATDACTTCGTDRRSRHAGKVKRVCGGVLQERVSKWNLNEVSCINGNCRASGKQVEGIPISFRTIIGSNANGRLKAVVVTIPGNPCCLQSIEIGDIKEGT